MLGTLESGHTCVHVSNSLSAPGALASLGVGCDAGLLPADTRLTSFLMVLPFLSNIFQEPDLYSNYGMQNDDSIVCNVFCCSKSVAHSTLSAAVAGDQSRQL